MRISDWSSDVCSSDLIAIFLIGRPKTPESRSGVSMLIAHHVRHDAAQRLANINGRKNALLRKLTGKNYMTVDDGAGGVHDGIIGIVAIGQHRIECRDRSARATVHARPFDQPGNK